ncbi:putative hybrid NRPS/PKS enzyme [Xylaria cf. heliscus]|nr:putative hybrid NRPS/PKS enzyme [Xylaria cf. heliscus]
MAYTHSPKEPIAIIGVGCRFPGEATSPSKLWELLKQPRDLSKKVPEDRFNSDGFYHANGEHHGASNVTKSYFIEQNPGRFDATFFNIVPKEAETIDPQQRFLLETVYEAMESAGLKLQDLRGSQTSAYVGQMTADFTDTQARDTETFSQYMATGTARALSSNRLSYFYDWHGPSMTIDTACSSSLTAVHLAVQSLRSGESPVACAAGVNLLLGPDLFLAASSLHMISPSGKSQMWDVKADGYARGEGIAAIFMKTLSHALRDGDRIDGLIRETGVNSDGRTKGITLPSPEAQAALIHSTYKNAGLDITKDVDRPQYFEAHGTGTQAGDPREASAISMAFFPNDQVYHTDTKLLVGSVKTVIGHTEGCAGLAGILKAVLAMKNKTVPPNQHLVDLNPTVAVSYGHLQIPTKPLAWPAVAEGHPLRASINSFGFGGTNSHAIVETYVPELHDNGPWGRTTLHTQSPRLALAVNLDFTGVPLVLSANNESSLISMVKQYHRYLQTSKESLSRIAQTLHAHRTPLPRKVYFSGPSRSELIQSMSKLLGEVEDGKKKEIGISSVVSQDRSRKHRILGVFTGQGAQWPTMGKALIESSPLFRGIIETLQKSLDQLPDPPEWSITEELKAPPGRSRLTQAALSQPLCTAVQVGLVELLSRAGISFDTVVGHSSGEIGAAYAIGLISASDAIRIAYYRGVHSKLAGGRDGQKGAMIAVGFGFKEAVEFCSAAPFQGRLKVAASNSGNSVTLSGDDDAVQEAKHIFDERGIFNRKLFVDTAYHSHHMERCAEAYTASLRACNIQIHDPRPGSTWLSSVYEGMSGESETVSKKLRDTYWNDNMVQTVLFSQALETAIKENRGSFDLVIEVGPHPALRGPALQVFKDQLNDKPIYTGLLERQKNDVYAFSNALGTVWAQLSTEAVNLENYTSTFTDDGRPLNSSPLDSLPTYPWDHSSIHFRESRLNKQLRSQKTPPNELLGRRTPDDTDYEPRWRNILKLREMEWLKDHRIQGEIVVPGSTYCVMALEAAKAVAQDKNVAKIEIIDFNIFRPITLNDSTEGVETLFSLRSDLNSLKPNSELIQGDFTLSAGALGDASMRKISSGSLRIYLGDKGAQSFPTRAANPQVDLRPMSTDRFYAALNEIGLGYTGPFRSLTHARRRMDMASSYVSIDKEVASLMAVHPTWLDVCIQTMFAAFAAPYDGSLRVAFVPTAIGRIIFSPEAAFDVANANPSVCVETHVTKFSHATASTMASLTGDLQVFSMDNSQLAISVEDMTMTSFLPVGKEQDRKLYLQTVWEKDIVDGASFAEVSESVPSPDLEAVDALEKIVGYYLNKFRAEIPPETLSVRSPLLAKIVGESVGKVASPSRDALLDIVGRFGGLIDVQLVRATGDKILTEATRLPSSIPYGGSSIGELYSQWQTTGLGIQWSHFKLISATKQIAHKHPRLDILQIGLSSDRFLQDMVQGLGTAFASYTIRTPSETDIDTMRASLGRVDPRIKFELAQPEGIANGDDKKQKSFGVVIVPPQFVTTRSTLQWARSALQDGGFLLLTTVTGSLSSAFFIRTLLSNKRPVEDELPLSHVELDVFLKQIGFSGVDSVAHSDGADNDYSVVVSQATAEHIEYLRNPLIAPRRAFTPLDGNILVLGGTTLMTAKFIQTLRFQMEQYLGKKTLVASSLAGLEQINLSSVQYVISLMDLDQSLLETLDVLSFNKLKSILEHAKTILWVTSGAGGEKPYQSAIVGLGRSFLSENPGKILQFLDLDTTRNRESVVLTHFLRLLLTKGKDKETQKLWAIEPEIAVRDGSCFIPRLIHDNDRNDRFNSTQRLVQNKIRTETRQISIRTTLNQDREGFMAEDIGKAPRNAYKAQYTSVYPNVRDSEGNPLHLSIGNIDDESHLLLSPLNASYMSLESSIIIHTNPLKESSLLSVGHFLAKAAAELQAAAIEAYSSPGQTTLLIEPSRLLLKAVQSRMEKNGSRVVTVSTNPQAGGQHSEDWIRISPILSKRELRSLIPRDVAVLAHCGSNNANNAALEIVRRALPAGCDIKSCQDLRLSAHSAQNIFQQPSMMTDLWAEDRNYPSAGTPVVTASELLEKGDSGIGGFVVTNWKGEQTVAITQKPLNGSELLSGNKTYLLAGLTGQTGQSICRWMVQNGARYIVMTSRNPQSDNLWKEDLEKDGVIIRTEAADITNKQDISRVCDAVARSLPPIAGVINGAMLLSDGLFADMSFDKLQMVMKPKALGSLHLDEIFGVQPLDFFIMFSSLSAVVGMPSQANYAAANNFMAGLAAKRRARGLAASVIDIGMIVGLGVVERNTNGVIEASLQKQNYMAVSERDLHELIKEAIVAGYTPGSSRITTGLFEVDTTAETRPVWTTNPRFSHLVKSTSQSDNAVNASRSGELSLREKLDAANGADEAIEHLEEAFARSLSSLLKLPLDNISYQTPVIDLGIDSLVAVEIRSWWATETGQDIPVLKILGGATVRQLCSEVASKLSFTTSEPKIVLQPVASVAQPKQKYPLLRENLEASSSTETTNTDEGSSLTSATSQAGSDRPEVKEKEQPVLLETMTFGQERIYIASQYLEDKTSFNCTTTYKFDGPLDIDRLRLALELVGRQHESFRTQFFTDNEKGDAIQGILERSSVHLRYLERANQSSDVETEIEWTRTYPFDLEAGDTFVATVLAHGPESHTIVFGYHHIIIDGVSWQIFLRDLAKYYNDPDLFAETCLQPVAFAQKQRSSLSSGAYDDRLHYWKQEFSVLPEPLPLFPFAKSNTRKRLTDFTTRDLITYVDAQTVSQVRIAAKASRTTSFHFWLAVCRVMLTRMLDVRNLCIGIVDANRSDAASENTVGFLLEMLPILFNTRLDREFKDILQETRAKVYAALAQTGVPVEEVLKAVHAGASTTHTPLFQVAFNYRMGATRTPKFNDVDMHFHNYIDARTSYDLSITVDEMDDGTAMLTFAMRDDLYDDEGMRLLADSYVHLIEDHAADVSRVVQEIPLFSLSQTQRMADLGRGEDFSPWPSTEETISKRITMWAQKQPDFIAVKDINNHTLTYQQMFERADAISVALQENGTSRGTYVAVLLEPTVDTICTILAILRLGAVYIPLDVRSSDQRLSDILEESGATFIVFHPATAPRASTLSKAIPGDATLDLSRVLPQKQQVLGDVSQLDETSVILYTSGSTGRPKGVELTNRGLRSPFIGFTERLNLGREVMLQQSGQGFDAALFQIFLCLTNGGTLIMGDNRGDLAELAALMQREAVTMTVFMVSEMNAMFRYGFDNLKQCDNWKICMCGGEAVTGNLLSKFRSLGRPDLRFVNGYGPTEASISSSCVEVPYYSTSDEESDIRVPIGPSMVNYGTYIVDRSHNPVPVGWPGELAICGPGVSKGYLNQPDLTATKFIPDGISALATKSPDSTWSRLYLTGDKAQMLSDGSVVMLGRMDGNSMVKLRGMRVHLDDVSNTITQAGKGIVTEAAVLVHGADENQILVAYVVLKKAAQLSNEQTYLRKLIQGLPLPAYMRPTVAVPMDAMPTTDRGKLDTKALLQNPLPAIAHDEEELDEDLTEHEARLKRVWRTVLGEVSASIPIRRDSDFFSVGGNSLLLLRLRAEIRNEFDIAIPVPELFQSSTLGALAARLAGNSSVDAIDWEAETKADDAGDLSRCVDAPRTSKHDQISVLLTGATGFLGKEILRQLVDRPEVASIHCVAVRTDAQGRPRQLLMNSPKIIVHTGDLAKPLLGLGGGDEATAATILDSIDVIIHNGATVSHMKNYTSLRAPNLGSTKALAAMAARHNIPLHYVSTAGVAVLSGLDEQPPTSLRLHPPPADGAYGYVATKWASEVYLENMSRTGAQGGQGQRLRARIHRPSSITGDDVKDDDIVHSTVRHSQALRAVPDFSGSRGSFDFIKVQTVAQRIAEDAIADVNQTWGESAEVGRKEENDGDLVIRHHSGESVVPIHKLKEYLGHTPAAPFKTLPMAEWVEEAKRNGMSELVGAYLLNTNGVIRMPLLARGD